MPEDVMGPANSQSDQPHTIEVQNTSFQRGASGCPGQQRDNFHIEVDATSLVQPLDVSGTSTNGSRPLTQPAVDETAIASILEGFPVAQVEGLEEEPSASEHLVNPKKTRKCPELRAAVNQFAKPADHSLVLICTCIARSPLLLATCTPGLPR